MILYRSRLLTFSVASYRNHIRHVVRFGLRFFFCMVFALAFAHLWQVIIDRGMVTVPWPSTVMAWYVALAQMMLFLSPRLFIIIENDVRSGDIAAFLIRPLSYTGMRLAEGAGALLAHVTIYYTLGIAVLALTLGGWPGHWSSLLAGLMLVLTGSCIHLVFQVATGLTAMWLHDADMMYRIYQKFLLVLGGVYMPVALYPAWLQGISKALPFYAINGGALSPLLDDSLQAVPHILILQAIWMVFALIVMSLVYRFCRRRIDIHGG